MRVFVTGATGWIGRAVVQELLSAGHEVLGLARSDKGAESLAAVGAKVHRGSLDDLESLRQGASSSDGVIHLAFIHDFTDMERNCRVDRAAIETMGSVLAGSNRPLIIASGTMMLAHGRLGTEEETADLTSPMTAIRGASEELALSFAEQGVRASVVRLPPTCHGDGDKGFISRLVSMARETGFSGYVGDGLNRWPATHRLDVARVFKLALDKGTAGSTFHAVAEEGVSMKHIAEVIGKRLDLSVVSLSKEEAQQRFGWLTLILGADNPTSSTITKEKLGWSPVHVSLIQDLEEGTYFEKPKDGDESSKTW